MQLIGTTNDGIICKINDGQHTGARRHSADACVDITKAALAGAVDQVTEGRRTQRYQQLAVLALVGCHQAGHTSPVNLLDELARNVRPELPPRASFVLSGLIGELKQRSIADSDLLARRLLPGVDLP